MERSSSQTRILAMRTSHGGGARQHLLSESVRCQRRPLGFKPVQVQHKRSSLPRFGTRPYLALMRLHDLVNDRESQSRPAFEIRLERLEYLFGLLRAHALS